MRAIPFTETHFTTDYDSLTSELKNKVAELTN